MEITANQVVNKMFAGSNGGKRLFSICAYHCSGTESDLEQYATGHHKPSGCCCVSTAPKQ